MSEQPSSADEPTGPIENSGPELTPTSEGVSADFRGDATDTDAPTASQDSSTQPKTSLVAESTREDVEDQEDAVGSEASPTGVDDAVATSEKDGALRRLDPGWVRLERMLSLVIATVVSVVAAAFSIWFFILADAPWNLLIAVAWVLLTASIVAAAIIYPKLNYRHWSYQLGERVIQIRHGIVWRTTLAIPLSRLQHVDLHRGPIERRCGLSTLEIHAAGTRSASHRIPGLSLETANELRDQLIDAANRGAHVVARD